MKRNVQNLVRKFGFEIRRANPGTSGADQKLWNPSDECRQMIGRVRANTMVSDAGLVSLYEQARYCETASIAGAFVECGVWKGGSVGLMAQVNLRHGTALRPIYLFDAFQDICEPDAAVDGDRAVREAMAWSSTKGTSDRLEPLTGFYDEKGGPGTVAENRSLLENELGYPSSFLNYCEGWFQDTLPQISHSIGPIAILRVDGDWYASTKVCLDYLAKFVTPGGFIIIDDYGAYEGCRKAVDEHLALNPRYLNRVNNDIRYWIV